MLFKLIYKDKSPEVKRTVETYNWYSPNVRVLIERVE